MHEHGGMLGSVEAHDQWGIGVPHDGAEHVLRLGVLGHGDEKAGRLSSVVVGDGFIEHELMVLGLETLDQPARFVERLGLPIVLPLLCRHPPVGASRFGYPALGFGGVGDSVIWKFATM